jgi:hypothetical protein
VTETVTKRLAVTFHDGLPIGTRGIFTYEKQTWIALPIKKYTRIVTVIDRLLGAFSRVRTDMITMINDHPEDAARIATILEHTNRVRTLHRELATEKCRSQTS